MLTSGAQKKAYPNTSVFQICLGLVYVQFNGIYKDLKKKNTYKNLCPY